MQAFVIINNVGMMVNAGECECKELIDKGVCDKRSIWNPRNCECECDKSCDVIEYLDYKNCKCRKKFLDKWVKECAENVEEAKMAEMALFEHRNMFLHNLCCRGCNSLSN